ncbi:MAG: T9SS type A sorting domain-containing protein, partial [Chitinophagales bacterium]
NSSMKNYTYTWTNSATTISKTSINYTFNLASIPLSYYDNNASIRFYLTVKDKVTGNIVAVKMIELALNPTKAPIIDFTPHLENHTLSITDVSITGAYNSVTWDLGDTYTSNLVTPLKHIYNNEGTYTISQSVGYGNSCAITKQKTVYIHYDTILLCEGSSYLLPDGTEVNTAGTYLNTLTSELGTDSVVIYTITQIPMAYTDNSWVVCEGQPVYLPDSTEVFDGGTYVTTLTNYLGCDSVITTTVEIIPASVAENTVAVCAGNVVLLPDSTEIFDAGTYVTTLTNYLGCDSVITTTVEIIPASVAENTVAVCAGQSVVLPDSTEVFDAGTYVTTLTNYLGCDSVITTIVELFPTSITDTTIYLTAGESYTLPDGTITMDTGTYYFSAPDINGCDSIIHTYILPADSDTVAMRIFHSTIAVVPNPVKNNLYITRNPINTQTDIQLFNVNGQLLATYFIMPEEISLEIPMHHYAASIYIIRVLENGVVQMFTVIKME